MIGKIAGGMILLSVLAGALLGQGGALGQAVLDSIGVTVELTLTLAGMMAFWNGMMSVLREAGMIRRLSRLARPLLRLFFPDAAASGVGAEEICANVTANLLGLGNAATPTGLTAMRRLQALCPDPSEASGDMITLAVLNTSPFSLLPGAVIALLNGAGASDPFRAVAGVWICSGASALFALGLCRLCRTVPARRKREKAASGTAETADAAEGASA